jgi:rhodanese-related sulfurtransferase
MLPQVMAVFDPEMAEIIHERLHKNGVATWLGDGVASFEEDAHGIKVTLAGGREMTADMVILSVGVRPDVALAKAAGIETGPSGGIKVDSHMRTNDENIFAVGDAVEVTDFVTGAPAVIALAGPANRQGRIAADNISGRDSAYSSTQGTAVVQVFDLTGACTGASERSLKKAGVAYEKIYLHPANHAGYYPGAFQMAMKVLFSTEDGRVLGAQIVGPDGVDKRIDVLATAMRAGMTVWDLEHLELAYAPPYGSAKDPVNMAGFVGASILKGDTRVVHWNDIDVPPAEGAVLLDVRTAVEVAQGDVEGALHIPVDELRDRFDEIPRDARVYVYCAVGIRGYIGERILKQAGYDAYNVSGGYKTLRTARPDVAHGTPGRDMFEELKEHFCSAPTRSAEQS